MVKTTLKIEGMACSMCEAHINDVVRRTVPDAQKVKSSYKKGECSFLSERSPDEEALRRAISQTGYGLLSLAVEDAGTKGRGRLFR